MRSSSHNEFNNFNIGYFDGNIITEDVYNVEIFQNIIRKVEDVPYIYLTSEKIKELLPQKYEGKRFLRKNKNVHIFNFPFKNGFTKCLNIEQSQIDELNIDLTQHPGIFVYDVKGLNKNDSLILVDKNLDKIKWLSALTHELIHYLQWNSGRSINKKNEFKLNIRQEDLESIETIFNRPIIVSSLLNRRQLYSYCSDMYYSLVNEYGKENVREVIKILTNTFNNYKHLTNFKQYWNNCISRFNFYSYNKNVWNIIMTNTSILVFILSAFYEYGFKTMINHLYSYCNKEK